MVQDIKEFTAKLNSHVFIDPDVLENGTIKVELGWTIKECSLQSTGCSGVVVKEDLARESRSEPIGASASLALTQ